MRISEQHRKTKETDISLTLCLEGGPVEVSTGIGFFDHMLTALAVHGGFGLKLKAKGDLEVDCHHTVEDTGLVLGKAFAQALGDKAGIDESHGFYPQDLSGRGLQAFYASFREERVGAFDTCMTGEFFRAFAVNAGLTLHVRLLYGENAHHGIEALFKAVGHALRQAVTVEGGGVLSTKGTL